MNGFVSKITLYDFLSMVIPGYLVVFLLKRIFSQECDCHCDEVTYFVVLFTVSYIVGMIIHQASKWIFKFLRNNKYIIERTYNKCLKRNKVKQIDDKDNIEIEYYNSYYTASQFLWSSIPVLESQFSFLRSMVIVEILYLILDCCINLCNCMISLISIVLILTVILMLKILRDISYRVWEDAHFIITIKEGKLYEGNKDSGNNSNAN